MIIHSKKQIVEFFWASGIAILLLVLIRILFFQVFVIPSNSMYPTLQKGDTVIVLKYPFNIGKIKKNDIVVFNIKNKSFVKRVVATEHDNIAISNGSLFVNNKEDKTINYQFNNREIHNRQIDKGNIYVLGDNAPNSIDSRNFGTIENDDVVGKVILIFSPSRKKIKTI